MAKAGSDGNFVFTFWAGLDGVAQPPIARGDLAVSLTALGAVGSCGHAVGAVPGRQGASSMYGVAAGGAFRAMERGQWHLLLQPGCKPGDAKHVTMALDAAIQGCRCSPPDAGQAEQALI